MKNYADFKVLVVGAGTMGSGIAQVFAANGIKTYMSDLKQEFLDKACGRISSAIDGMEEDGLADEEYRKTVKENLTCITNEQIPDVASELDLVFEVIYENEDAKREIFATLNKYCSKACIFASNTSGMDIFSVCKGTVEPLERLIIAHWFNPPHLMKLIEVVRGPETGEETAKTLRGMLEYIGKKPAVLNHFCPGFIVNRIATVVNRELYYMIDQGWISPQDAENAIRYTDGLRWGFEGPLGLWDFVGLEIPLTVAKGVLPSLCNNTDGIPLGEKMIKEGKTGVKAGEGMLKYPDAKKYEETRNRRIVLMSKIMNQFDEEDAANE